MSLLNVENLSVTLNEKLLVASVSFALEAGETLCLVGESGSGKTLSALAAIGLLPGNMQVKADRLAFDGHELLKLKEREYRALRGAEIGMVFQEPMSSLNPVMRVGRQVEEVFAIHTDLNKNERRAKVLELFEKVKIDDPAARFKAYPHELSGGQRQRVMIAMALAMNPKLLIADEPTTALDVTVQREILALMKSLQKELHMGLLFITHDFGVVRHMADQVVVMQHGRVVESGSTGAIMDHPKEAYTRQLLAARLPATPAKASKKSAKKTPLLKVENLSKSFPRPNESLFKKTPPFVALQDVSFTLEKGEVIGVVGESGSGKSTLARCLTRLIEPDSGRVTFRGEAFTSLKGDGLKEGRRHMQMVFQDPFSSLNPRMRIGETVGEGLRAHGLMAGRERQEYVKELLNDVGLPSDSAERYPHEFSGGQRQRIGIARALALKPDLVIADEATSALDVSVQKQILDLLGNLREKYNLSYLFISHDLRVIAHLADRVLVMHKGAVVEQGAAQEIFARPQQAYTKKLLSSVLD